MREKLGRLVLGIVMFLTLWAVMPEMLVQAAVKTGTFGDNGGLKWTYDEESEVLTITGEDSMVKNMSSLGYDATGFRNIKAKKIVVKNCTISGYVRSMFSEQQNAESIVFDNFDTSQITDMSFMFYDCTALTSIDLSGLDTSNVTNMASMFSDCTALTSIDFSGLDTSNVTHMSYMFGYCKALTSIDLSGLDTSNVIYMSNMFSGCTALTSLNLSGFDTSKVVNMGYMFSGCTALTSLNLSGFDTSNVVDMGYMFNRCYKLASLDLGGFDTSRVTNLGSMFSGCTALTSLNLSGFDTSKVTEMDEMFFNCSSLTKLDLSNFDTTNVTNMNYMFSDCKLLPSLDVSGFDTSNVTSMSSMFDGCSTLKSLDVSGFDTSNVRDMSYMFSQCNLLPTLDVSAFNTSNVTSMSGMFSGCSTLKTLNLGSFDTSNAKAETILADCSGLTAIKTPKRMKEGQNLLLSKTFYDIKDNKWTELTAENANQSFSTTKMIFADVDIFSWQYTPAQYVYNKNIMVGKGENELGKIIFDPNKETTRAEFVQILYNKEGKPNLSSFALYFDDVKSGDWFEKAVMWAAQKGIVSGKGDKFGVSDNITREEVATILYNYAKYKKLSTKKTQDFTGYTDADQISSWAVERMQWALAYGIMKGKGERLDPKGNATRAECATMIKNFIDAY